MTKFDLNSYETVDERLRRFWADNPNARIATDLVRVDGEVGKTRWVTRAEVYKDAASEVPTGTGYAFEVDGQGMANQGSALENCETSAIGRALANAGYSGNKRANRMEMAKAFMVQARDEIASATTKQQLQGIWRDAQKNGVLAELKTEIEARVAELNGAGDGAAG